MERRCQETENPAARRSKAALMTALSQLLREKDLSEITISEITDRAGLSRQAFYTNFSKKEDILDDTVRRLFELYGEHLGATPLPLPALLEDYFQFWAAHDNFLSVLFRSNLGYLFLARNTAFFQDRLETLAASMAVDTCEIPYIQACLSGVSFHLLRTWILQGKDLSVEELVRIWERF